MSDDKLATDAVEVPMKPPRFTKNGKTLAAIEDSIIRETGDGEFAAYVVKFLRVADAAYRAGEGP